MDQKDIKEIEEIFKHHIKIFSEKIHRKLDIVIETIKAISEKIDRVSILLIDEQSIVSPIKIDRVAVDLSAHRADTQIHKIGYQVRESKDS